MSIHIEDPTQILLHLPRQMLSELDSIAKSRQVSRTALIRWFLSHQIQEELKSLEVHLENTRRCKKTHLLLQDHLKDKERW
jgi:metal-responsive CopG/Arc/MetJ family transcriptional regulator